VLGLSDRILYKKPGAEFPRTAHTYDDAMDLDTLTQKKN
jgi:hypothetical protein